MNKTHCFRIRVNLKKWHFRGKTAVDKFPRTNESICCRLDINLVKPSHVEGIVLLSKLHAKQIIEVELEMKEMDLTTAENKATYEEIKERENYNKLKSDSSKTEKKVVSLLIEDSEYTSDELVAKIGVTKRTIERAFISLQNKKVIKRIGSKRAGSWIVIQ